MAGKHVNARNKSGRKNKKRLAGRRIMASVRPRPGESNGSAMKRTKANSYAGRRASRDGVDGSNERKVAVARPKRRPVFGQPKTELEQAIQRYVDLFDFAPIGYVTFDRVGRIEEVNFAAVRLLRRSRNQLIGVTFAVCVAKEDTQLFLDHLMKCRSSNGPAATELCLKRTDGEKIPVLLSTTATLGLMKDGARLFQTAIVDLTERKQAQERLERAMEFDEAVMTNMGEGLYTVNPEGFVTTMNPAAEKLFGWRFEELRGKKMHDVTHYKRRDGSHFPAHECGGLQVFRTGQPLINCEDVFIRKDGTFFDVIYSSSPIREGNKISGLVVVFRDITEQKRTEAAAMRFAALVRSSRDAVVAKDLNGIITDWNRSAQRIFGYEPKEIIGKSILTLIPPERHFEETEILRRIRSGESIDHYETIRRRKDGRLIDVSLTISPIKDLDGQIIGVSKIARDITDRKAVERRLTEQGRLLNLTNDAIFICDMRNRITFWNDGAIDLYGYSVEEALGKVTHELLCTQFPKSRGQIRKKLERDGHWSGELVHQCKNGSKVVVMSRWSLDRDKRGKPTSILETNTDITLRKSAEVALQRSKEALELTVRQRTKELLVANSELKGEIERRKGLEGEILSVSDREQQRLGQELHDGLCQHLTAVAFMARSVALRLKNHRVIEVGDIEKIAQLVNEAGTDTRELSRALHRIDVDAVGLVNALQDLVDREIWKTPCRLEVKPSFHIEDDVAAGQLYRIAREAVINANKHAQARKIIVNLEGSQRGMVLRVTDDGTGVAKETKLTRGLGFHIMNYRAQSIGGSLKIDSLKQGGTCVSCYLPNNTPQSLKSPTKKTPHQRAPSKIAKALATLI